MKRLPVFLSPFVLFFSACYHAPSPQTYEERVDSQQRLRQIQDQDFKDRDRERRSAAQAGGYYLMDPGQSGPQVVR